jgi:hypothetical protein
VGKSLNDDDDGCFAKGTLVRLPIGLNALGGSLVMTPVLLPVKLYVTSSYINFRTAKAKALFNN